MTDLTCSEKLARHHASLSLEQVPGAVVETAKLHILDSIGCLLAGGSLEPGKFAYQLAGQLGASKGKSLVTLPDEVQAMAAAAHCGEMDDIHSGSGTCIGAMVVPGFGRDGGKIRRQRPQLSSKLSSLAMRPLIRVGLEHRRASAFCSRLVAEHDLRFIRGSGRWRKIFKPWRRHQPPMRSASQRCTAVDCSLAARRGRRRAIWSFGHAARSGIMALLASGTGIHRTQAGISKIRAGFCHDVMR